MRVFCYKCTVCGRGYEVPSPDASVHCAHEHTKALCVRDYRAEGVSVDAAVGNIRRDFESEEKRDLFLPTRTDFERQHGHKGERAVDQAVKEWNDTHEPHVAGGGKFRPK